MEIFSNRSILNEKKDKKIKVVKVDVHFSTSMKRENEFLSLKQV